LRSCDYGNTLSIHVNVLGADAGAQLELDAAAEIGNKTSYEPYAPDGSLGRGLRDLCDIAIIVVRSQDPTVVSHGAIEALNANKATQIGASAVIEARLNVQVEPTCGPAGHRKAAEPGENFAAFYTNTKVPGKAIFSAEA
jgi:hypothetical protein